FGWWGAFLSHNRLGDVLTDSKSDHTPLDANCRQDDYFPSWFSFLNNEISDYLLSTIMRLYTSCHWYWFSLVY
ncbi:unnamed protein product, partial [Adineta steineri]